ncbi:MAG: acyltransferase [Prevotellaceae bacterium]|jgi:peptidoglycan/LPS O-acetylase OafA/YrhL|nr:acyltransferase [Prevotellaceae bacterium]MDD7377474.1 acyltransferase [Prevotellaceae bacterium]PWL84972.1 MAG: acyltransferase [Prevotellaceae bacterium]
MNQKNVYLASKPRYAILDGLRGVAALVVILFHGFETYIPFFGTQHINHGYLAVDFFFVLSGFVIGYAYDDRWDRMSTWSFFKRRLIRLHPMVVAGTLFGACLFFFGESDYFSLIGGTEPWKFFLCIVLGLLMIPAGTGLDIRGWGETNSLNGPNWSLTFEYIGNILYAFVLRRLPTVVLGMLCVASAFLTMNLALGWDVFGFFAQPKYDVIGGWSITPDQMYVGFSRLLYPFLCGLLISRLLPKFITKENPSGSPLGIRGGFWWASLLLVVLFAVPQIGGKSCVADGLYQVFAIVVMFPVIVLIGAGSKTTDKRSAKWCETLGNLSYPLYITHFPLMYMQMAWVSSHKDSPVWHHVVLNLGILLVAIGIAWAFLKLYDEPVRAWLKKKLYALPAQKQA